MFSSSQLNKDQLRQQIDIVAKNVSYFVDVDDKQNPSGILCWKKTNKRLLLNNISAIFKAGQITAIMGGSGSGKTTLVNSITQRLSSQNFQGQLSANGLVYNFQQFGDFGNYIMQNDILFQTMTVRETLKFAADLKLNETDQIKNIKIIELANQLKLQKCMDTLIGGSLLKGISGGERKRVSIGFQLLSDPAVIVLDEPTSGLDSLTAFVVVRLMKKLTQKDNKTIIMTIHQPNHDIYSLFDNLLLLIQGNIVYQGKATEAVGYFAQLGFKCPQFSNPPDYFMSIIHPQSQVAKKNIPFFISSYNSKQAPTILANLETARKGQIDQRKVSVSATTMLKALLTRDLINIIRNPVILKARLLNAIILCLIAGGLFFGVRQKFDSNKQVFISSGFRSLIGALFFFTIMTLMSALSPVSLTFPIQREVFRKERSAKMYNVTAYFLSRNMVEIPYLILIPMLQTIIIYWMVGLTSTAQKFFVFYFVFFLMGLAGSSLGLLLGSMVSDPRLVTVVMPMFILPLFSFSGFYKNRGDLPTWIGWIQYISPSKYGFIALCQNQIPSNFIKLLSFDLSLWTSIAALIGLSVGIRLLSLFFLWSLKSKLQ